MVVHGALTWPLETAESLLLVRAREIEERDFSKGRRGRGRRGTPMPFSLSLSLSPQSFYERQSKLKRRRKVKIHKISFLAAAKAPSLTRKKLPRGHCIPCLCIHGLGYHAQLYFDRKSHKELKASSETI